MHALMPAAKDACFAVEKFGDVYEEAKPLLVAHWEEIAQHQELMWLNVDVERYHKLAELNNLLIITARIKKELVGYVVFILFKHIHYKHVLCAQEDIHYLMPTFRQGGLGYILLREAIKLLPSYKVQYVTMREKVGHEHPALMKRLGFQPLDLVYARKLEL